jgi:hypothetical protein
MMAFLKALLTSKKAAAMVAAVIMTIIGKKVGLDEAQVTGIVGSIIAYIIGQGIADNGKEAAKVTA